jgi:hypothetical protein
MAEIKTNARGISKLLLNYPLELRLRCKRMAQAAQQSEQAIIRTAIERHVSAWEAEHAKQPEQPTRKPRTSKTQHPLGVAPKTRARKAGAK